MSVLLLRLAGPLQSWGSSSRFTRRETRMEPTKSGVLGLLAAASGRRRSDPIEDLAALRFGVRVDQPGRLMRDFQTAHRGKDSMPLSHRFYLSDAVFVAGVEGEAELLAGLDEAVRDPEFPLFLGRRSCPPSHAISMGISAEQDLVSALNAAPWQANMLHRRRTGQRVHLRVLTDSDSATSPDHVTEVVRDIPLSFSPLRREYGWRDVVQIDDVVVTNPDGRDELDFFETVRGA